MRLTPRRWRTLLWVLMVAAVLFAVRPLTSPWSPETLFPQSDKILHMTLFGVLWHVARRAGYAAGWLLALALVAYGVGIEIAQALVPTGRSASIADVAADTAGVALAWWFGGRLRREPEKDRG